MRPRSTALSLPVIQRLDRKSTRLNSSHVKISYAVFCLKKKTGKTRTRPHKRENLKLGAKRSTKKVAGKVTGKISETVRPSDLNPTIDHAAQTTRTWPIPIRTPTP